MLFLYYEFNDEWTNILFLKQTTSVIACYIGSLIFLWKPEHEFIFSVSSIFVWIATTSWVANFFNYLRISVFVLFQFSLCGGYIYAIACKCKFASLDFFLLLPCLKIIYNMLQRLSAEKVHPVSKRKKNR